MPLQEPGSEGPRARLTHHMQHGSFQQSSVPLGHTPEELNTLLYKPPFSQSPVLQPLSTSSWSPLLSLCTLCLTYLEILGTRIPAASQITL